MSMMRHNITYISDQGHDYVTALSKVRTLHELWHLLGEYRRLFPDAWEARPLTPEEFRAWRAGLRSERRGVFAGMEYLERYGTIMLPEVLMQVGRVAAMYKVPWGCAYIRLRDVGRITEKGGVSRYEHELPADKQATQ